MSGTHTDNQYGEQLLTTTPFISSYPTGDICSSPTCRAVLHESLERTGQFIRELEDLGEKHDKMKAQTKLELDAMNALKNAYTAFGRRLDEGDIEGISRRAGVPYDIPGHYIGSPTPSEMDEGENSGNDSPISQYTSLSSTGL